MILSVKDVQKAYGKEQVIKGISFDIQNPQIIALVGPNGSGKSTLLNIITNLLPADKGEITILNKTNKNPDIFKEVSFMQDNTVLYDYLTGYDHLQFIGDVQGISKEQLVETAKRVGITSYMHKKVGKYSLGMKQHLLLTMAIVNNPKLLILDEPLNGLDPTSAIKVRNLLLDLHKEGTTILLSSHNMGEIDRVTSTILFLKDGSLIKEDISLFEKTCYDMQIKEIEKAKALLIEQQMIVENVENKLRVYLENVPINDVLTILQNHSIVLLDLEKIVFGTEDRYQKIFQTKGDSS